MNTSNKLYIDFETYCDLNLKKVGAYKYVNHPSFHPWCMAYAFNDEPIKLWVFGTQFPSPIDAALISKVPVYAHNAEFEWLILKKLKSNDTNKVMTYKSFVDVMALAGTFGYPLALDKFVKALGLPYGKTAGSTRLINKLCTRQKKTAFNTTGKWTPKTAPDDFKNLYEYCMNDVHIMREAVKRLPQDCLSEFEQFVWGHTVKQNWRGVRLDIPTVKNIVQVLRQFKKRNETRLQFATGGNVQTGKQTAKIKDFLWSEGVKIPNLQKDTVNAWLNREYKPIVSVARDVLNLRQQLAHSSTAKFDRMLDMEVDEFIYGMLKYFGAHTGRYAGTGVQLHNLPRAQFETPLEVEINIGTFNTRNYKQITDFHSNINETASKLIRPMIIARPNHKLIVSDYISIENVLLHWCADDEATVQEFRERKDQYKTFASARFKIDYNDVSKDQRQYAKPSILGLQYGGGSGALLSIAGDHGIDMTHNQAVAEVKFYRQRKYPKVPKLWYAIYNKAIDAIRTGDVQIFLNDNVQIEFRYVRGYLTIKLPSGRVLWYPETKLNHTWTIMVKGRPVQMEGKISYMGLKNSQWMRVKTHPGFLTENIIQAMARDILVYGAMCAEQAGYPILFSVHDELVSEVRGNGKYRESIFSYMICTRQEWAENLPLRAEGYEAQRYRKE